MTDTAQISTEYVPLDDLLAARDGRNPKLHDLDSIEASIRQFGFVDPVIRDGRTGRVLAGHGRLEALDSIRGLEADPVPPPMVLSIDGVWLVPVSVGWSSKSDDEAGAVLVALNRHTERGGWDDAALVAILSTLDADLARAAGYEPGEMDDLLAALDSSMTTGAQVDPSFTALREGYTAKQVRSFILVYSFDDFERVQRDLARLRASRDVEDNASLVALLLAEAT